MVIFAWILLVICASSAVMAPMEIGKVRTIGSTAGNILGLLALSIFLSLFLFAGGR